MQGVKKYLLYGSKLGKAFPRVRHLALSLFYQSVKRRSEKVAKWKSCKVSGTNFTTFEPYNLFNPFLITFAHPNRSEFCESENIKKRQGQYHHHGLLQKPGGF